jgi:hypothetical protein
MHSQSAGTVSRAGRDVLPLDSDDDASGPPMGVNAMPDGVFRQAIPERPVSGKRLGRHINHDPRSLDFAAPRQPITSVCHRAEGLPLNQGEVGSCTAEALCGALDSEPNVDGRVFNQEDALKVYTEETILEKEPYPEHDPGGSGLEVCKAARKMGLIQSYQHAFGVEHALEALVVRPVITGINWYTSFDHPDPQTGLVEIAPDATVRGGHEIVADEIDAENELVWFWNSWGSGWGVEGRFCMSFATWDQLLKEHGDVTVPIK